MPALAAGVAMRNMTEFKYEHGPPHPGMLQVDLAHAVRAELDAMLTAPIFAQSTRCKRFLSFIVLETLSGNAIELKERTIGITVFDRANDYNTGDDSIVRVTANEVRKRIGQFYLESGRPRDVRIELPRGAYVPEFRFQPGGHHESAASPEHLAVPAEVDHPEIPIVAENGVLSPPASLEEHIDVAEEQPKQLATSPPRTSQHRTKASVLMLLGMIILASSAGLAVWRMRVHHQPPDVWGPLRRASLPVLICLGAHDLPVSNLSLSSAEADQFPNLVLRKQVIPVDDAAVITGLGSMLGVQGIPFRVTSADPTSLAELRRQPVILVGALDNRWSLRITEQLPYRLERVFPDGEPDRWTGSIVDAQSPTRRWTVSFGVPMSNWQHDYALIARFDDATTGVPVLVEAGLGNNGSLAASEFLMSHRLENALAKEPSCRGKNSFEAVVETEIIDAKAGPPHALNLRCW